MHKNFTVGLLKHACIEEGLPAYRKAHIVTAKIYSPELGDPADVALIRAILLQMYSFHIVVPVVEGNLSG